MRRLIVLAAWAWIAGAAFAATHVDDSGRAFEAARPPQRIVTLAPSLTELVFAVGAGTALVGVDQSSDFPPAALAIARIGDYARIDVERLVALKPDVVLAWRHGNPSRELAQLEALGLPLFHLEPRRLDDVPRALERLGALLGREVKGREAARALRAELERLRALHAGRAQVDVFYQVWRDPLLTLNHDHLVSDVIALCGGRNLFAGLPQLVPQLSIESVVAARPEAMLATRIQQQDGEGARREPDDPGFAPWRRFGSMPAVQRRWMFTLPGDTISRQGPRIVQGARALCEALQTVRDERDLAAKR
jgi:iron complex transport system substrate-binding protein